MAKRHPTALLALLGSNKRRVDSVRARVDTVPIDSSCQVQIGDGAPGRAICGNAMWLDFGPL